MDTLSFLFSDHVWLPLLELLIAIVFFRSVIYDIGAKLREGGSGARITRGEATWPLFFTFWGLSIILIEIILSSDLIANHRVIISLINVGVLFYLSILSVYFKNKIIGWHIKLSNWSQQI